MSSGSRHELRFSEIAKALRATELPHVDLVIGIARGGVVLATLAAYELGVDMKVMRVNYRDDSNSPRHAHPVVLSAPDIARRTRVLLVDDVSVTGSTLDAGRAALAGCSVQTLVLKGKADHVLFPDIKTCINVPWSSAFADVTWPFETEDDRA
jgi:xanthine phosphoribosyltransferase